MLLIFIGALIGALIGGPLGALFGGAAGLVVMNALKSSLGNLTEETSSRIDGLDRYIKNELTMLLEKLGCQVVHINSEAGQFGDYKPQGFLSDYSKIKPVGGDSDTYKYRDPSVDVGVLAGSEALPRL